MPISKSMSDLVIDYTEKLLGGSVPVAEAAAVKLRDAIGALETLNARKSAKLTDLEMAASEVHQCSADAELGRLVRRMPEEIDKYESWTSLQYHRESNYDWYPNGWQIESSDQADAHQYTNGGKPFDTPEAAIKAALGEK